MGQTSLVAKGLVFELKLKIRTKNVCFVVKNVQFVDGPPNQVVKLFKKWTRKCQKSQMFRFQVLVIQMFTVVIQMVTIQFYRIQEVAPGP